MINNDVTGNARLKFKARNNIEILSGDYYPNTGGYIDLSINETLALDCPPPPFNTSKQINNKVYNDNNEVLGASSFSIYPNPTSGLLNISCKDEIKKIIISDITGKTIYSKSNVDLKESTINISKFQSGIYVVSVETNSGETKNIKIVKD